MRVVNVQFGQKKPNKTAHKPIQYKNGQHTIPNHVVIPYINGDGIGPEIMVQARRFADEAVNFAYDGTRSIKWKPLLAGKSAMAAGKPLIPDETKAAIEKYLFFLKSPLETPVGGGFRSINVALRKMYDMFACVRPVSTFEGVKPSLTTGNTDVTIFRENTEDLYQGLEFSYRSKDAADFREFLRARGYEAPFDGAFAVKTISKSASERIIKAAFDFAIENQRPSVTVVHKGNILPDTDGAFLRWAQKMAKKAPYNKKFIDWDTFDNKYKKDFNNLPKGKIVLMDRIADNMFQDVILNPGIHSVVVTTNLNGDYLSDAFAATVGGLGLAPGKNQGKKYTMFEATHGTAPDIAGQGKANPTSLFLSTVMMLNQMGWSEAAQAMIDGIKYALAEQKMTGDLARFLDGVDALSTAQYTDAVIDKMREHADTSVSQTA